MLSGVQRLFAHHLIEAFGCDYSSSGVTLEALSAKIKTFLELRTADGPRHDTYLIYYSGHCHPSGEWALAGEGEGQRGGGTGPEVNCVNMSTKLTFDPIDLYKSSGLEFFRLWCCVFFVSLA